MDEEETLLAARRVADLDRLEAFRNPLTRLGSPHATVEDHLDFLAMLAGRAIRDYASDRDAALQRFAKYFDMELTRYDG